MCACLVNGTLYGLRLGLQDDPFHTELSTIINAIREPNSDARERILSSYDDGVKTYELVRTSACLPFQNTGLTACFGRLGRSAVLASVLRRHTDVVASSQKPELVVSGAVRWV